MGREKRKTMYAEMKTEKRQLSKLNPAEYNPRKALTPDDPEYQKIRASIEAFGYADPIIINKDGTIIGGHQRYSVLLELGYDSAKCVVLDLDKDAEKALNIALNNITGEWDDEKLKALVGELNLNGYDLSLTGFDDDELKEMIGNVDLDAGSDTETGDETDTTPGFTYHEQYGVIVMCSDEANQEEIYNRLIAEGYECKVVTT